MSTYYRRDAIPSYLPLQFEVHENALEFEAILAPALHDTPHARAAHWLFRAPSALIGGAPTSWREGARSRARDADPRPKRADRAFQGLGEAWRSLPIRRLTLFGVANAGFRDFTLHVEPRVKVPGDALTLADVFRVPRDAPKSAVISEALRVMSAWRWEDFA